MRKSTVLSPLSKAAKKHEKPYADYPLFPHATKRWAKKVRGKLVYFGRLADDPTGTMALELWKGYQADLFADRVPGKAHAKPKSKTGSKPRSDFPIFPHASGRWAKKVRGKFVYFGKVSDDPQGEAALNLWLDQRDDLLAGRIPRIGGDGLTMRDLANAFLTSKKNLVTSGELTERTFADYHATCERLVTAFGKNRLVTDLASDDFEALRATLGKTWGPVAVGNEINRVRVVFKYAFDTDKIDRQVRFGPGFKRPSRKALRKARAEKGSRLFEAAQLRKLIDAAGVPLKAMLLLAANCGLGNSDCGQLELRHLERRGWLNYPRPKTAVERRCPLWPETVKAIKEAIAARPNPKDPADANLVFITRLGAPWAKEVADSPISKETTKLLDALDMRRPGLSFYSIRHTFQTIGDGCRDQAAVSFIMGHAPHGNDMSAVYREGVDDKRLKAVVSHVRKWLFPPKRKSK